jgi:hypothetical protein
MAIVATMMNAMYLNLFITYSFLFDYNLLVVMDIQALDRILYTLTLQVVVNIIVDSIDR